MEEVGGIIGNIYRIAVRQPHDCLNPEFGILKKPRR